MKMQTEFTSLSLGLVASLMSAAAPAQAPACKQPQYTVTDLGALGKGNNATMTAAMLSGRRKQTTAPCTRSCGPGPKASENLAR
jgi:hypothetical protein